MTARATDGVIVFISQVYVPDPASVGQHMADLAGELVRRGHRVVVFTSRNGYDDPSVRYPAREVIDGVHVRRLPFSSFGKRNLLLRGFGAVSFIVQAFLAALLTPRVAGVLFTTSPPLAGAVSALAARLRGVPSYYWVMDLNPDQVIALGHLRERSFTARFLSALARVPLRHASLVIALDSFMAQRLVARGSPRERTVIIAPWPHLDHDDAPSEAEVRAFRREHDLEDRFVVMYSGNHTPTNPLDTLLDAALALRADPRFRFVFVGGGAGKPAVEAFAARHELESIVSLPYQPLERVPQTLAAADVQVVTLGDQLVGIVHPCKVYGAMAAARPVLYIGPRPSHVTELLDRFDVGWHVLHGDAESLVTLLRTLVALPATQLDEMGRNARVAVAGHLSQAALRRRLCEHIEDAARGHHPDPVPTGLGA